ncbi:MAG: hypothetical protein DRN37_04140 [Thermoplasmata archaeon]|nr:MAG: hypothetical protein DRN37_04140 [Thermoplasmata archaeon]
MASQRTKFSVGLFVASGICIAILAIIWLGMSRYLEKGRYYVTYFNESVQGLTVDSPVKYRGVSIGRVEKIDVAPDSRLIEVVLKIESGQSLGTDVVAQLKSVGITGSMFVELDRRRPGEPDRSPTLSFPSKYPIVASKPSSISELLRGIDEALRHIKSLDLEGISDKIKTTLDSVNGAIADANIKAISRDMQSSIKSAGRLLDSERWDNILSSVQEASRSFKSLMAKADRSMTLAEQTLARVDGILAEERGTIKESLREFRAAMENANTLLRKGTTLASRTDDSLVQLKQHLMIIARNLEKASENLNRAMEALADQPSQLLLGQPPKPRKVEPET